MTSSAHQVREALGHRLRDLRRNERLTGRQLAERAGWHSSKVSKIEYGKQTPSEDDIRIWCRHTSAVDQLTINQSREIALYAKAFDTLSQQAIYGPAARALITTALDNRRNNPRQHNTDTPPAGSPAV